MRRTGGWAPQAFGRGEIGRGSFTLLSGITLLWVLSGTRTAAAEPSPGPAERTVLVVAISPIGSAVHREASWDGGFGGELMAGGLRDSGLLAAWGAAAGGVVFAERGGGRVWLEVAAATRWPTGLLVGVAAGPTVALDELRHPRVGAQVTVWAHAGIAPYVRAGQVDDSGRFVELGLMVPLPVIRW